MKQYVSWKLKPVEWGFEHPITHDRDKEVTGGKIDFLETQYMNGDNVNIWIIEYDETIVTQEDLILFASAEPLFKLTILTELEVIDFLSVPYNWEVTVQDFIFTDNREVDFLI